MQTIGNFRDWQALTNEGQLELVGARPRPVTLDVNAAGAVALHVVHADGEVDFLGRFVGREKVRFIALPGDAVVLEPVDVSVCWVHKRDGEVIHRSASVKEAFTKYHERQPFDPNQAAMLALIRANMQRLDDTVAQMKAMKELANAERARADQAASEAAAARQAASDASGNGGTGQNASEQSPGDA